jgi:hypothetical protein
MNNITENITEVIETNKDKFEATKNFRELEKALEEYNEMLKLGIIKKRGYNLISIGQTDINQPSFNTC